MHWISGWMLLAFFCCSCATGGGVGHERLDARLVEAQADFDEATKRRDAGEYPAALERAERALALREAVLGARHPDVAQCLHLLGDVFRRQADLTHALPLFERALAIREAALGHDDPSVAQTLNALGAIHFDSGAYARAEALLQRSLAIREARLGDTHPSTAQTLNNLANLYTAQSAYGRAEPLMLRALAIYEESLGKTHPKVALSLTNLAEVYTQQEMHARGAPLLQRALAIQEATLGAHHPDLAVTLNNLATLYFVQGLNAQAEPLNQRALSIRETAFGRSHPQVADSLNNLATLYMDQGLYARAEPLLQRALGIDEAMLGAAHPDTARTLLNLAEVALARHHLADAVPRLTRAFTISEQRLRQEALGFSEERLSRFLHHLREDAHLLYALLRMHPDDARVQRLALSAVLLLKGRSAEETANIFRTVHLHLDAGERTAFEQLRGLRTQLATHYLVGPGPLSQDEYQRTLKTLADTGDALEADLAQRSATLRALTTLPPFTEIVDRVAASLPRDGVLVEFIPYTDSLLGPGARMGHMRFPQERRYLALVLSPDASIRAVDLGPARPVDLAATRLRDVLANRDASVEPAARELYQRAFAPLRPLLEGTHRVLLSPDGQLGLVPFAALHDGDGFLLDTFDFTYLTSGRELLPRSPASVPSSSVVVLADPDFQASAPARSAARGGLSPQDWTPLPGTYLEARDIQRLVPQAQLFLGAAATKQRLLHLSAPGILHLATHGFFIEGANAAASGSRGLGLCCAVGDEPRASAPREPLLSSGLALAGAASPAAESSANASLVTALELAGMNLWGTQLVVLSACDTGRGDVQLGEGIQGLRRSLMVAGAETVVMSLWKVNDDSTRLLMEFYYRNLLAGQGRASALREAMRSLRASHPHPHDWAPFLALGSDAPLREIMPVQ